MKLDFVRVRAALPFLGDTALPPLAGPVALRDPIARLLDVIGLWFARRAEARRERLMNASLAGLDAAALRDLGIHRSEIASIGAEWSGYADTTRQRIAPRNVEIFALR